MVFCSTVWCCAGAVLVLCGVGGVARELGMLQPSFRIRSGFVCIVIILWVLCCCKYCIDKGNSAGLLAICIMPF